MSSPTSSSLPPLPPSPLISAANPSRHTNTLDPTTATTADIVNPQVIRILEACSVQVRTVGTLLDLHVPGPAPEICTRLLGVLCPLLGATGRLVCKVLDAEMAQTPTKSCPSSAVAGGMKGDGPASPVSGGTTDRSTNVAGEENWSGAFIEESVCDGAMGK